MPKSRKLAAISAPSIRESPRKKRRVTVPAYDQPSTLDNPNDAKNTDLDLREQDVKSEKKDAVAANNVKAESDLQSIEGIALKRKTKVAKPKTTSGTSSPVAKQRGRKKQDTNIPDSKVKIQVDIESEVPSVKKQVKQSKKIDIEPDEGRDGDEKPKKAVQKRKTKEEKAAEAMPAAARTTGLQMFVGAHVSITKGIENAIPNALYTGCNAFALFLKNQRRWETPALKDENRDTFKHRCEEHHYDQSSHVLPHGSYLVNLAAANPENSKKSYDSFVDDLKRCEALGIKYYNFHPGTTNDRPHDEAIARLAANLNRALAETSTVTPLLENMAGHKTTIGARFSDLRDIIAGIKPEFKHRIGICIDTCHTFAAGYDLRTPAAYQQTFQELDDVVGLQYLKAMHLNDSKAPLGSHRDLHQNIGIGFLGLRAFHNIMNDVRLQNIPLILETPSQESDPNHPPETIYEKSVYAREIKLLESLTGMDPESDEFKVLEARLSEQGRPEREKMEQKVAAKEEKARKKAKRELEKGQKNLSAMLAGKGQKRKTAESDSSSGSSESDSDA